MEKRNLTLLTDLYQLTMMNGYYRQKREGKHRKDVEQHRACKNCDRVLSYGAFFSFSAVGSVQRNSVVKRLSVGKSVIPFLGGPEHHPSHILHLV